MNDIDKEALYEFLIEDSVRYMSSLTQYMGVEAGMEAWKAISQTLGDDIKAEIFFRMVSGEASGRLVISRGRNPQAVPCIKAIRIATGLGLKEAKDLWDRTLSERVVLVLPNRQDRSIREEARRALLAAGMLIH